MPATTATMRAKQKRECINLFPNTNTHTHTQYQTAATTITMRILYIFRLFASANILIRIFSLFLYYFLFVAHAVLVIIYFHSTFLKKKNRIQKHTRIHIYICIHLCIGSMFRFSRIPSLSSIAYIISSTNSTFSTAHNDRCNTSQ